MPLIPATHLSLLAVIAGILCVFSLRKLSKLVRSSLLQMYKLGLVLLAPALISFGVLYFYFQHDPAATIQVYVRWLLVYLFSVINIWQVILLKWGKAL